MIRAPARLTPSPRAAAKLPCAGRRTGADYRHRERRFPSVGIAGTAIALAPQAVLAGSNVLSSLRDMACPCCGQPLVLFGRAV
ncbi:hypothetical protein [Ferrovibrio xuzhouensis]|uniref:Uncharacterized protein n=1 Tax=Ferrovibrio xuzhouensis TaxID=1576914 RepID=A0ABV7VDI8_9PROT